MKSIQLAALLTVAGAAQAPVLPQSSSPNLSGRLGPRAFARATLLDGRIVTGRFTDLGEGRLGVRSETGRTDTLAVTRIQAVAIRGHHTKTGAVVGGATGLAAGIFIGYMIGAVCDAAECNRGRPYLFTIPLFGGGGTLLGAAIGAAFPRWKQVYP